MSSSPALGRPPPLHLVTPSHPPLQRKEQFKYKSVLSTNRAWAASLRAITGTEGPGLRSECRHAEPCSGQPQEPQRLLAPFHHPVPLESTLAPHPFSSAAPTLSPQVSPGLQLPASLLHTRSPLPWGPAISPHTTPNPQPWPAGPDRQPGLTQLESQSLWASAAATPGPKTPAWGRRQRLGGG